MFKTAHRICRPRAYLFIANQETHSVCQPQEQSNLLSVKYGRLFRFNGKDTISVFAGDVSFVLRNVRPQNVLHKDLKTQLLLRTQLLQNCSLFRSCLKVSCKKKTTATVLILNRYKHTRSTAYCLSYHFPALRPNMNRTVFGFLISMQPYLHELRIPEQQIGNVGN